MGTSSSRALRAVISLVVLALVATSLGEAEAVRREAQASETGVTYVRDDLGRVKAVVDADGSAVRYHYDAVGNVLSVERLGESGDPDPTLIEFSPKRGEAGDELVLEGVGFDPSPAANAVTVGGVAATVLSASATMLTVEAPAGVQSGPVVVTVDGESTESDASFAVSSGFEPSITAVSPVIAAPGDTVTVSGENFDPEPLSNRVSINGLAAAVVAATTEALEVAVPPGATGGRVHVVTADGEATFEDLFVPPGTLSPEQLDSVARSAVGDSAEVGIDTAYQYGLVLLDGSAGQQVAFQIVPTWTSCTPITVYTPTGQRLGTGCVNEVLDPLTLPEDGTYTVLVRASGTRTGTADLLAHEIDHHRAAIEPGGQAVTVPITVPGQRGELSFEAGAGDRLSLRAAHGLSCVTFSYRRPSGTNQASKCVNGSGTGAFWDTVTLSESGEWTLVVDPPGAQVGDVEVTLFAVPDDVVASVVPGGASVAVETTVPGQDAWLEFEGSAGQWISVSVAHPWPSSWSYLRLRRPDGSQVYSSTVTGSSPFFRDSVALTEDGVYRLQVDPRYDNVGEATVTLHDATPVSGSITAGGAAVTVPVAIPGQRGELSFAASEGDRVSLRASHGLSCVTFAYRRPDGSTQASKCVYGSGTSAFYDTVTLDASGEWTVLVDPSGTQTGDIDVELFAVPGDVVASIVPGGPSVVVSTTVPGQDARLQFEGTSGQRISVSLEHPWPSSWSYLRLVRPDGTQVYNTTVTGSSPFFRDSVTLPIDGTYTLVVNPRYDNVGEAGVTLHDSTPGTVGIVAGGPPVDVEITVPGEQAELTFDAAEGDRVSLRAAHGLSCVTFSYRRPDGSTQASKCVNGSGTGAFYDTVTLDTSGEWTLLVNPSGIQTGEIVVELFAVPDDVVASVVPGGPAVAVETTVPGQDAWLEFEGSAGQWISVSVAHPWPSSWSYLRLRRPDGSQVYSSTVTGSSPFFRDSVTLTEDGVYRLQVDPRYDNVGEATVTLHDSSPVLDSIVAGGPAVTVPVAIPGQRGELSFTASEGDRVSLRAAHGLSCVTFAYRRPDGTNQASKCVYGSGTSAFYDTVTLDASGEWTVLVDPSGTQTGDVDVELFAVPGDVVASIVPGGPSVAVSTTVPGQDAWLEFEGSAGQRISMSVAHPWPSSWSYLRLRAPDDSQVFSSTMTGSSPFFRDTVVLPADGLYRLHVDPRYDNVGEAGVTVFDATQSAGSILPGGDPVVLDFTVPGQQAELTFEAEAGDRVSLRTAHGLSCVTFSYRRPDGSTQASKCVNGSGTGAFYDTVTLSESGEWTLLVNPSGIQTGEIVVELFAVPDDVVASVVPGGPAVAVETTVPGQDAWLEFEGSAEQWISVSVAHPWPSSWSYLRLLRPDGSQVYNTSVTGSSPFFRDSVTLTEDGVYRLHVNPRYDNVGEATVTLHDATPVTGSITAGGDPVTVPVAIPGQRGELSFTASEGDRVSLRASHGLSCVTFAYRRPDGTNQASKCVYGSGTSAFWDTVTLDASGEWTMLVDPSGTQTGDIDVELFAVPGDAVASIVPNGPSVAVETTVPGQDARLEFEGSAGQWVAVTLEHPWTSSWSYLRLVRPDGTQVYNTTVTGSSPFFRDSVALPVDGTYTLVVNPRYDNVGEAGVTLHDSTPTGQTITPGGDPVVVDITVPGEQAELTFAGAEGDRVSLRAAHGLSCVTFSYRRPSGTSQASKCVNGSGTGAFWDTVTLSESGEWTLLVSPSGSQTGELEVTLFAVPDDVVASVVPGGAAVAVETTVPGQDAWLEFEGSAGQWISVSVAHPWPSSWSYLRLRRPDGSQVYSSTVTGSSPFFRDSVALTEDGVYRLQVDPRYDNVGEATVTLHDSSPVLDSIVAGGDPVTVPVAIPGQRGELSFTASEGDRVSLRASHGLSCVTHSYRRPDGTNQASKCVNGSGTGAFYDTVTLDASGEWTVLVDPSGTQTGDIDVELFAVPDDVVAAVAPNGPSVAVETTVPGQDARLEFEGSTGQWVAVTLEHPWPSSWSYVRLLRPDGTQIYNTTVTGSSPFFRDSVALPEDGTYTLVVNPRYDNVGEAGVTLHDTTPFTAPITAGGEAVTVPVVTPGQRGELSFEAEAGDRLSLRAAHGLSCVTFTYVRPSGSTHASKCVYGSGTNAFYDTVTLSESGEWTLLVNPSGTQIGDIEVELFAVPDDVVAAVTPNGPSVAVETTVPGQDAWLEFEGSAEQWISVSVAHPWPSSWSYLRLLRPDGSQVYNTSVTGSSPFFRDSVTLTEDGVYRLHVNPRYDNVGEATVTLHDATPVTGSITAGGAAVTVPVAIPGQRGELSFTASEGDRVSLRASHGLSCVTFAYRRPDGTNQASKCVYGSGTSAFWDTVTLSESGEWTLLVDPSSAQTGDIDVELFAVPGDVEATATLDDPLIVETTVPGQDSWIAFDADAGQRVSVRVEHLWPSSWSYLRLRRPDGSQIYSNTVTSSPYTRATVTLAEEGTYTLHLDPRYDNVGEATVTVQDQGMAAAAAPALAGLGQAFTAVAAALHPLPVLAARRLTALLAGPRPRQALAQARGHDHHAGAPDHAGPPDHAGRPGSSGPPGADDLAVPRRGPRPKGFGQPGGAVEADPGVTAVAGQVVDLDGAGLRDLTVSAGRRATVTDHLGRFTLTGLAPGRIVIQVDGSDAPGGPYGTYTIGVEALRQQTVVLDHMIWLPRLDTAHEVSVTQPLAEDLVLSNPAIPGLELHVPAGSVIRDTDGNQVEALSLTPVPLDRPPFPLPDGVIVPTYFTIQPGGATIEPYGAKLVYPNAYGEPPGTRFTFWRYVPELGEWEAYGEGTVTPDGKQVVPDPGVGTERLSGAMVIVPPYGGPDDGPPDGSDADDADPVDLATGLFVYETTDMVVNDVLPIRLDRRWRPNDSRNRPFGRGMSHPYELYVISDANVTVADLYLEHGSRIRFERVSQGTGVTGAVLEHTSTPSRFQGATMTWNGWAFDIDLADGTRYVIANNGPLQSITDRNGNTVTVHRLNRTATGAGTSNITRITTEHGRWLAFSYDSGNRVTRVVDNAGRETTYTYDSLGRMLTATDPLGGVTTYTWDAWSRIEAITDPRGVEYLRNTYDGAGRVATQRLRHGPLGDLEDAEYTFAYTFDGGQIARTRVTDPRGLVREVEFNEARYPVSDTYAPGTGLERRTTYELDPDTNQRTAVIDPAGRRTSYTYDAFGNVTSITYPAGTALASTVTFTYAPGTSDVTSMTDPEGRDVTVAYDERGNVTAIVDHLGRAIEFAYDAYGRAVYAEDATGRSLAITHDGAETSTVTDDGGATTSYWSDAAGRMVLVEDPWRRRTRFVYDDANQVVAEIDPLGGEITFAYDAGGNLTSVTDPRGGVTAYAYDGADRLVGRTDPLGATESYRYDAGGLLTEILDRKGQRAEFSYDALGRLTLEGWGAGPGGYEDTVAYTYDALDRITEVDDSDAGTIAYAFDDLDRVTSETTPEGQVTYGYDRAGRLVQTSVAGTATTYAYDTAERLTGVTRGGEAVTLTYDGVDRLVRMDLPGGVRSDFSYDARSQLVEIAYEGPAGALGNVTYTYDEQGRRSTAGGSLLDVVLPPAMAAATYDAANRVTSWGGATVAHDANGNVVDDGTRTFSWDVRDRLVTVTDTPAQTTTDFAYDARGRRTSVTTAQDVRERLHVGTNPAVEFDGGGQALSSQLLGLGYDEFFTRTEGSDTFTYLVDALGSTLGLVDSTGAISDSYAYTPFGATDVEGTSTNPFAFTGRELDATGLYYYRARYYNPEWGRFLSEDPMEFATGDLNLYAYVYNDPVTYTDPTGEIAPVVGACLIGAATGALIDLGDNMLSGRKTTWGDMGKSAAKGCLGGMLSLGIGKVAGKIGSKLFGGGKKPPQIKPGSSGGETAGKPFPKSVKDQALKENPDTCVYCRMKTDKPQVDHAIPKSKGGNATLDNAQTTCPHCNPSKGARDTPVNPPPGYRGPWPPPWWP